MKKLASLLLLSIPFLVAGQGIDSSYFENYSRVINLSSDSTHQSFDMLDSAVREHEFFFTAEQHWKAVNSQLQFSFLQYLHQKAGVRNLLLEGGYSYAFLINKFLETGDHRLLEKVLEDIPICPKDQRQLFERIRSYNLSLPKEDWIQVHGIDLEHSPILSLQSINNMLPAKEIPNGIAKRIERLLELHQSPYYDKAEVKKFFRGLNKDIKRRESDYRIFWGEDFEIFQMITLNTVQAYRFTVFNATFFKKSWEKREERMYANFLLTKEKMKNGKFYAQFGALHTDINTSSRWEFPTLANRLNYSTDSPVKGKVLTISRYFRKLNSDYQKPGEYKILESMMSMAEKRFSDSIVLFSMVGNKTPFKELSKTFQYIILIDPDLEQEGCE
ncbi:MAG: hypothetical protein AAFR87_01235 [Bacteroidota bacterium]